MWQAIESQDKNEGDDHVNGENWWEIQERHGSQLDY